MSVEDECRSRFKVAESRLVNEIEETRRELFEAKRKAEDAERAVELLEKKSTESLSKNKEEIVIEFERAQRAQLELQDLCNQQKAEIKRMREDGATTNERLASTLQSLQASAAECELAKQVLIVLDIIIYSIFLWFIVCYRTPKWPLRIVR